MLSTSASTSASASTSTSASTWDLNNFTAWIVNGSDKDEALKVEHLDLSNYNIFEISELIGLLKNLRILNCSLNYLTVLPESITNLTKLEKIDCSSNKLTKLPTNLNNLINLNYLSIHSNQFESILPVIKKLSYVKTIIVFKHIGIK